MRLIGKSSSRGLSALPLVRLWALRSRQRYGLTFCRRSLAGWPFASLRCGPLPPPRDPDPLLEQGRQDDLVQDPVLLLDQVVGGVARAVLSPILGFLSVLMGIGGGSFGVPTMTLFGVPIHRAVATAAGFGVIIAVPSVIGFLMVDIEIAPPFTVGAVNFLAFGLIVSMTLITAPWGAALAHRLNPGPLKRLFGGFLILVALNMLRKAFGW